MLFFFGVPGQGIGRRGKNEGKDYIIICVVVYEFFMIKKPRIKNKRYGDGEGEETVK